MEVPYTLFMDPISPPWNWPTPPNLLIIDRDRRRRSLRLDLVRELRSAIPVERSDK